MPRKSTKYYECPICHQIRMANKNAQQCRVCYLSSDKFHEQLRSQSKRANKRANEVRWAHKDRNWIFSEPSEEIAYVVGAFLTDGWIQRRSSASQVMGFSILGAYREFIIHIYECLNALKLNPVYQKPKYPSSTWKGRQIQYRVATHSQEFGRWLDQECGSKEKIPDFLWEASIPVKLAFLAGLVDGDGCVGTGGNIVIFGTKIYMSLLPDFLERISLRTGGYHLIKILSSGKGFYRVSIHRADFINAGGKLIIRRKNERFHSPVRPPLPTYVCPKCKIKRMKRKQAKQCQECWRHDPDWHEHLRRINLHRHHIAKYLV